MRQAAAVEVQHPDAAAHCQEVGAAVKRRQVDEDGPEAALHLQEDEVIGSSGGGDPQQHDKEPLDKVQNDSKTTKSCDLM